MVHSRSYIVFNINIYAQCANFFFHLNKTFRKMIKKTWQYMLNVIPHIFSPINFCVRTLVFFITEEHRIFWMYEINRFFTIKSLIFVQICPEWSEILSTDSKNPRAADGYVQHNKILNLFIIFIIRVAAVKILILHLQRKKVYEEVQSWNNFQRESCLAGFQALF